MERPSGDQHRTLLEISNALISNLNRDDLFHAIARALRQVLPVDRTAIFLHDPGRDVLRLFILDSSVASDYFSVGYEMSATDSHVGQVFQRQQPLLRRDLSREREYAPEEQAYADGIRSYVLVPLIARGASIGALAVASTRAE